MSVIGEAGRRHPPVRPLRFTTLVGCMSKYAHSVPDALPLRDALGASVSLAQLRRRLDDAQRRRTAILPCLPPALAPHVSATPADEGGWTLVAANAGVAAKLRQLQPRMEQRLADCGFAAAPLRIKVRSG